MRELSGIKPQDILVLLKILTSKGSLKQIDIAKSLELSQAEVSHAISRLKVSNLLSPDGAILKSNVTEFLTHGLKYVFPPTFGPVTNGVPTGHSLSAFDFVRHKDNDVFVWPYAEGKVRGQALLPIYDSVPSASLADEKLHQLLALIDMIRAGRAREVGMAIKELKERISEWKYARS